MRSLRIWLVPVCAFGGLLATGAPSVAAEEPLREGAAGSMIYVDPETGNLTGDRPEGAALPPAPKVRRSGSLPSYTLPGGGTVVELDDRFLHSTILRRSPDGTLSEHCEQDAPAEGAR